MTEKPLVQRGDSASGSWVRRWGTASWFLLGIAGAFILFGLTLQKAGQLVWPLVIAVMLGIVLAPIVDFLYGRLKFPRWLGAAVTMILIVVVIVCITAVIVYGIVSQADTLDDEIEQGVTNLKGWLGNLQLSDTVIDWIQNSLEKIWPDLIQGVTSAVTGSLSGIASFLVGLILGLFILFFLLSDDGTIYFWTAGKLPVSTEKADVIMENLYSSIRGYFRGTTIVAASNAVVVLPVLLLFRMPLVAATSFIIFVTGYIPSIGGYIGGAFAVFIALASKGLTAALVMLVVLILANTVLQQPVQAWAYHRTLELHPLVALLVTVAGAIFAGLAGAVLAVPITAIITKVKSELDSMELPSRGEQQSHVLAAPDENS